MARVLIPEAQTTTIEPFEPISSTKDQKADWRKWDVQNKELKAKSDEVAQKGGSRGYKPCPTCQLFMPAKGKPICPRCKYVFPKKTDATPSTRAARGRGRIDSVKEANLIKSFGGEKALAEAIESIREAEQILASFGGVKGAEAALDHYREMKKLYAD